MVDFGDDALTAGRAHPMIDPTLRLDHLERALNADDTAVVLLDVVLGHGAEPDPAAALAPVISGAWQPVVVTVVGTAADPQGLERQVNALAEAGAEVHLSNAGATRRAIELTQRGGMNTPTHIVSAGAGLFADAVAAQAVAVTRVDWHPPMPARSQTSRPWPPTRCAGTPTRKPSPRCWASPRIWSTSHPRARCSGSSRGSSCMPAHRSAGTGRPGPSAAG